MAAPAQFAATRQAGTIELYLSPTQPPIPVPPELRDEITDETWAGRLVQITQTASRYNKLWFERIWLLVGLLAIFIVPVAIFRVLLDALHVNFDDEDEGRQVLEARGISAAIFVGLVLFFLVPIAVWKYIGQKQVNAMLKKWQLADGRGSVPLSTWTVKTPGVFRNTIVLRIQLPPGKTVSAFNFDAYLPSYLNGPADPEANYYYPYNNNKAGSGMPRISTIGNVPLFTDEKKEFYGSEKV